MGYCNEFFKNISSTALEYSDTYFGQHLRNWTSGYFDKSSTNLFESNGALYCYDSDNCLYLPGTVSFLYFGFYLMFMRLLVNFPKAHEVTTNITSMVACWSFLYTNNLNALTQYYWYDLVMSIVNYDIGMIIHHICTLFVFSKCPSYSDYPYIGGMLYLTKSVDVFMHHYKITSGLQLDRLYPVLIPTWQLFTVVYTILMWTVGRIIIPIWVTTKLNEWQSKVIAVVFISANIYWVTKLGKLSIRIVKKITSS